MYVNKITSVPVNRKAYNDMREHKRANERARDRKRERERERERDRQTYREREREREREGGGGGFCFVFYCLDINELRWRYSANMRTGMRTCVV